MSYTDEEIRNALLSDETTRNEVFRYLYYHWPCRPKVFSFLRKRGVDQDECQDIYKDGLVALDQAILTERYTSKKGDMQGYFFGICRFIWMKRLNKDKKLEFNDELVEIGDEKFISTLYNQELSTILNKLLSGMKQRCRDVIKLWSLGFKMKEIAQQMGYANEVVARKSKHQCLKTLTAKVKNNEYLLKELKNW